MNARALCSSAIALGAAMGLAVPAQATSIALVAPLGLISVLQEQQRCGSLATQGLGQPAGVELSSSVPRFSKSSAILGGVSQLERIRQEQAASFAGSAAPVAAAAPARATTAAASWRPQPAAAGIDCSRLALPQMPTPFVGSADNSAIFRSDDYLMSRRLAVHHTAFDRQWDRVRNSGISSSVVRQFSATTHVAEGTVDDRMLEAVNSWTNHHIRYAEDSQLYRQPDYWANAQATFRRGAGDCEDIAIAKLQLLARLGVPQSDMFLTIARDLARNADHAMLIVKRGDRYWLLDNGTDRVLDASANYDYRPILSFSGDRKWLHGFATAQLGLN